MSLHIGIVGGSETPLIMNDANSPLPTLDSTRLLARAACRGVRGGESKGTVGGRSGLCLVLGHGSYDPDSPVGAPDEPVLEGWAVLAALAAVTSRIRLATLCTAVGYRNPAHLAKIAASIDLISRGRLTLGIGAGFFEEEYKQYGWEFPPRPATRIRQMEEAVELIPKMWTEPRTTFHGRYFHVEDAILEPKPVQKPRPPVMIAGGMGYAYVPDRSTSMGERSFSDDNTRYH
jgi:hypothetical protein